MPLPFFYKEDITATDKTVALQEEASKHIIQVLRMRTGEKIQLTDGKGNLYTAEITSDNRKKAEASILSIVNQPPPTKKISIAVSIIKNASRFEWFLEKATEIGVTTVIPLICERTEKQHFRHDRMNAVLVSAMLQSQQTFLPLLREPVRFDNLVISQFDNCKKFIAHCEKEKDKAGLHQQVNQHFDQLILIGPEGDFTAGEIESAIQNQYIPVALGNTRLRTETAGVVAATLLKLL